MRRASRLLLPVATCVLVSLSVAAEHNPNSDLISRYQRENSELAKRDLALKMIDSGVLKLSATTSKDVAKIFGADWTPDIDVGEYKSYGIVHFAKQPTAPSPDPGHDEPPVAVPFVGWYLVIHYNTKDQVVFAWELSNVHK
jgi:hypothetical protein